MFEELIVRYNEAIYDTDRETALEVVAEAVQRGATPEEVIFELVVPAMNRMIKAISEDFDANLAQHFVTAQIAGQVTEEMISRLDTPPKPIGHMVIGAPVGDLHTLGKRIVIGCLKAHMIESTDLGVNVAPELFVREAVEHNASIIGISAMMVHTATGENGPKAVRRLLKEKGLEDRIKIIVGGAPFRFDPNLYLSVGADAWASDGIVAADTITRLVKEMGR